MRAHPTAYQVAALFVGAVVGAGFASGQEVWQFFAAFGGRGVASAIAAGVGLGGAGALVLFAARRVAAKSYSDLLRFACPRDVRAALEVVLVPFLFFGTAIMFAGAGALAQQELRAPYSLGVWATAAAVAAVAQRRLAGVLKANAVLVPLMCITVLAVAAATLAREAPAAGAPAPPPAGGPPRQAASGDAGGGRGAVAALGVGGAALVYICYNAAIATVALAPLGQTGPTSRAIVGGAVGGGLALGGLAAVVAAAEVRLAGAAFHEVPLAAAAAGLGTPWRVLYDLALWAALFTTAAANVLGLQTRLGGGEPRRESLAGCGAAAVAGALSYFGFSRLVVTVYPLLSLAGAIAIAFLVRKTLSPRARR